MWISLLVMIKKRVSLLKEQLNFLEQGFERNKCIFDNEYNCTHYWAVRTMQECGDGDCNKKCCKGCKKLCGYKCNASSALEND